MKKHLNIAKTAGHRMGVQMVGGSSHTGKVTEVDADSFILTHTEHGTSVVLAIPHLVAIWRHA